MSLEAVQGKIYERGMETLHVNSVMAQGSV